MKKIVTLFVIFVGFLGVENVFAQTREYKKIAKKLCECTQKMLDEYPPLLSKLYLDIAEMGEEKAEEVFLTKLMSLPENEREAFTKSMDEKPMQVIMEKHCSVAKEFIQKSKMNDSSESALEKILEIMKKDKKCKQGYAVMSLGLKSKN